MKPVCYNHIVLTRCSAVPPFPFTHPPSPSKDISVTNG